MIVYALSGKAEHGKNHVADILQNMYENNLSKRVCQLANGDYLKFLASKIGYKGVKDEEDRTILQQFGTEYVRNNIDSDFWVEEVCKQIFLLKPYYDVFIITDCRFENELLVLDDNFEFDCVTIRVERPNHVSKLTEEQLNHPSEVDLDNHQFDYTIINDGTENIHLEVLKVFNDVEHR